MRLGVVLHQMLDALEIFRWGKCMLAHMFHEMHEIVFHGKKTMAAMCMCYRSGHGTIYRCADPFMRTSVS